MRRHAFGVSNAASVKGHDFNRVPITEPLYHNVGIVYAGKRL